MDPFSAATGVAGLISMGIEVCKGLDAYCRNYRSKDSEILALSRHAKELESFLDMIESRMKAYSEVDQALATTLEDCHATCNMCLQDFAALNTEYARPKAVPRFRKQGKAFVRQIQFPFQKDKFDGLRSQMLQFQKALSSCLILMNYDRTMEVLHTTVSEAAKISSAIMLQGQRTADQISSLLPHMDKSIDEKLSKLEQLVLARSKTMEGQVAYPHIQEQQAIVQGVDRHGFISDDNAFHHDRLSTERSVYGIGINRAKGTHFWSYQQLGKCNLSTIPNLGCNCRCKMTRSQFGFRSFDILEHQEQCPLSFLSMRGQVISGKARIFSTLLSWKVSVRYSQFFLRNLQLLQSLKDFGDKITENEAEAKLLLMIRSLHQLFMNHEAWPTGITDTDQNLLHRACSLFSTYEWPSYKAHLFVKLLAALVSMGVPINGDGRGGTPLHWFLLNREFMGSPRLLPTTNNSTDYVEVSGFVARELMSLNAVYSEKLELDHCSSWALLGLFPFFGGALHCMYEKGFDYGELSSALIRRSEVEVRQLLGQSSEYMFERGHHEQTPLHISVYWPQGLAILFELAKDACASLIDATDSAGHTPLQCAIYWANTESVALFLEQNATVNLEDTSVYVPFLDVERTRERRKGTYDLLTRVLVDRRTEMLRHALEHLPESELIRLGLRNMMFLKDTAFEVVESFKLNLVRTPAIFEDVRPGSLYHARYMDDILAEALFNAGFDSIDSFWNGYTPLMIVDNFSFRRYVRLINWFCQKQANLLAVIPNISPSSSTVPPPDYLEFRAVHRVASILGDHTAFRQHIDLAGSSIQSQYTLLLRRILSEVCRDPCQCYCSPGGCGSTSLYTKTWYGPQYKMSPRIRPSLEDLNMVLDFFSEQEYNVQAAFVRVCTFDRLGMRHTCCTHVLFPCPFERLESRAPLVILMDPVEVKEIQEEDQYLVKALEELMIEFKSRLRDRPQSFRDFWKWWNNRMDEIDAEKDPIPDEDIKAMVDTGVHLEV